MAIHNAMHQNLLRRCSLRDKVLELKPNFKSQFWFVFFFFYHYLTSEILFPYL